MKDFAYFWKRGGLAVAAVFGSVGITYADNIKLCDVTVEYTITQAPAGTPAANLPGVWVGTWDGGMCSALIVESVDQAGTVKAWYVWGTYSPWRIAQPGKSNWNGKLSGATLAFERPRASIHFTIASPTSLSGVYSNAAGQTKGMFTKK